MPIFLTVFSFFLSFIFFHGSSGVRHRVQGGVSSVKREGGIHWLHNRDNEDDDNNTWNGNSTQQMWWNDPRLFKIYGELKIWSLILNNSC